MRCKNLPVIAAAVLLVIVVTGIAVLGSPARRYDRQLSLGEKYLDELDYEKAIAAYTAAIEIDPKNPKYLKVVWGVGYKIDTED